ncbi:MAG: hypothetical protein IKD41_04105 [Alistipes sp.]|nr:hypothetical protein [Alistipes sp.]
MKQFNAAHLEIKKSFAEGFETHPYECGWADEAIFFIFVEDIIGQGTLNAKVQISLDGIHWADEGTSFDTITEKGLYFVKVTHFGNYLRLKTDIEGAEFKLQVQVAVKG